MGEDAFKKDSDKVEVLLGRIAYWQNSLAVYRSDSEDVLYTLMDEVRIAIEAALKKIDADRGAGAGSLSPKLEELQNKLKCDHRRILDEIEKHP